MLTAKLKFWILGGCNIGHCSRPVRAFVLNRSFQYTRVINSVLVQTWSPPAWALSLLNSRPSSYWLPSPYCAGQHPSLGSPGDRLSVMGCLCYYLWIYSSQQVKKSHLQQAEGGESYSQIGAVRKYLIARLDVLVEQEFEPVTVLVRWRRYSLCDTGQDWVKHVMHWPFLTFNLDKN